MKFYKMEKLDFPIYLWERLSLNLYYEFGVGYSEENDTCSEMYCIKKIAMPGTLVFVCNRMSGGKPFAFDINTVYEEGCREGFISEFWDYLCGLEGGSYIWVKSGKEVQKVSPQQFHKKDIASFKALVLNCSMHGQVFDFYAVDGHDHFCIKRVVLGDAIHFVATSCEEAGKVFLFEFRYKELSGIHDRFYTAFGEYLTQNGFTDTVMYRRHN